MSLHGLWLMEWKWESWDSDWHAWAKERMHGNITWWILLLQEFNIIILDKPGHENVVVYLLSRITSNEEYEPLYDYFPNEHLFSVSLITQCWVDIANYILDHKLPQHFSSREKSALARKSPPYTWIKGYLFKVGPNWTLRKCVR